MEDSFHNLDLDASFSAYSKARSKNKKNQGKPKKGKTHSFYHANIAFDVINHEYTDVVLQPGFQKNEDKALLQLVKRNKIKNTIFIPDRGYESQPSFYLLDQNDVKFVCRFKDEDSKGAITKNYPLPIQEEYDTDFNIILTNKRKKSDAYPEK